MPKDYWYWWWTGFGLVVAVNVLVSAAFDMSQPVAVGVGTSLLMVVVWMGLTFVGFKRNETSRRNFAFWWSIAMIVAYSFADVGLAFSPEPTLVPTIFSVIFGVVLVVGGPIVIVVWLVGKSRSGPSASTRACPVCAEQIQVAAVKCRFCGETLALT